jgi:hypothetical protein
VTDREVRDAGVCCTEFDPTLWDEKTHAWENKPFLKDQVRQLAHIPVNMSAVIRRMCDRITRAGAMPAAKDFLMLAYDPSPWKSELYMSVTRDVPDGEMATISGTFFSKVFDGPYHDVPTWLADMNATLARRGQAAHRFYVHYAYCPKCRKRYGHNYCVVFAQLT